MEASGTTALFLALGIMVAAARFGGGLARRLGQPRVLGELLVGLLLGPSLLDMLRWPVFHGADLEPVISEMAELGVLLLMFIVGLEVNISELAKVRRVALLAGFLGAVLPVVFALPIVRLGGYDLQPALFAGVVLAATSVSISAQVLLELGLLRSKEGTVLLATALVDDVLAILLLSVMMAVTGAGNASGAGEMVTILLRMAVYLAGAFAVAWWVLPPLTAWISRQPYAAQSYGIAAFAFVVALVFAWSAQELGGVAPITGAFIAGVGLRRTREAIRHEIESAAAYPAYGLLVPVFFLNVGLHTDLHAFPLSALPFAALLLVAAVASKVGGCGLGAKLCGYTNQESLRIGICMISRGEVGLIMASVGLATGIFSRGDSLFTSLFLVILLTTLLTPILVRQVFPRQGDDPALKGQPL